MDTPKLKQGCNITEESTPHDVNDNGVDEESGRYAGNPKDWFWSKICKIFKQKEKP